MRNKNTNNNEDVYLLRAIKINSEADTRKYKTVGVSCFKYVYKAVSFSMK